MADMQFVWDQNKADTNLRKHGISFDEAKSIFFDAHARLRDDPDHSQFEDRFIILGMSYISRILVVVHCYRETGDVIRIISAREATNNERRQYEDFLS